MRTALLFPFLCILLFTNVAYAQTVPAPGYLGRKFSVRISAAPHVTINTGLHDDYFLTGWSNKGIDNNRPGLKLNPGADLVMSRRLTVGFSSEFMRHGIAWKTLDVHDRIDYRHVKVKYFSPALEVRYYPLLKKGNIAPVGPFTMFRLGMLRMRLFNGETEPAKGILAHQMSMPSLRVGMGYQTMLTDRIPLVVVGYVGVQRYTDSYVKSGSYLDFHDFYLPVVREFYNSYLFMDVGISVGAGLLLF